MPHVVFSTWPPNHFTCWRARDRNKAREKERVRAIYVRRCESLAVTRLRVSLFYFLGFSFWKFLFYCVNARTCSMLAHNTHLMSNICECVCKCLDGNPSVQRLRWKKWHIRYCSTIPMASYDWCSIQFIRFSANAHFTSYYDYYSLRETCQIEVNFPKIMWEKHTHEENVVRSSRRDRWWKERELFTWNEQGVRSDLISFRFFLCFVLSHMHTAASLAQPLITFRCRRHFLNASP